MEFKEELRTLVDYVETNYRLTKEEQSIRMKKGKNYISDLLTPSGSVAEKALYNYKVHFRKELEALENIGELGKNEGNDVKTENTKDTSLTLQALIKIAASNEMLAKSNLELSSSNKIIAEANKKLSESNAKLTNHVTASAPPQNSEVVAAKLRSFQELLVSVATGRKFESEQEVRALLNKIDLAHAR